MNLEIFRDTEKFLEWHKYMSVTVYISYWYDSVSAYAASL